MKVSIVTASFNAAPFLRECLLSAERQEGVQKFWEHIIVDGGSKDGTLEILKSSRGIHWISEPDKGQSDAFNKGVRLADGEWICWLNADDMLKPEAFLHFQKTLQSHPSAGVIYGHVEFVNEAAKPLWICYHLPYWHPLLANGCYVPPSSGTFFRKDLLLREPLDASYHYVMDVEWFHRCGRQAHPVLCDRVFSQFRISASSKTSAMIQTGSLKSKHAEERERYRKKYVYPRWPGISEEKAAKKFELRRKCFNLFYHLMKMRYAWRYLKAFFRARKVGV